MNVRQLGMDGLLLIEPTRFRDDRGWFAEAWQSERYRACGITHTFVQDNLAESRQGVLRGLHAQVPHPQAKLIQVLSGRVYDVAVDARPGSPTFGRWEGVVLDAEEGFQFYLPAGFLHGYYVLSASALLGYKVSERFYPEHELTVRWNDPDIGITWPLTGEPLLSDKDANAPPLGDIALDRLGGL